ncbi:MAG: hypothetical protein M1829_002707 [Trizodia sp. TS-e1964]|nr:MAG: hypothetical protein M1829_002707 [Trizodia sp. TS-e1964]
MPLDGTLELTPRPGGWPADPQQDVSISKDRIWVDGCFDFSHHGHAGAMLQARRLGNELIVGVHSDEAIMENKGPSVMTLRERIAAVDACRWSSLTVPYAPYVTAIPWIDHYGCKYVVHGDDVTSDSSGEDCYRFVKKAGRFKVVKRTPGISTTDLVGRMLLCTKGHFIKSLTKLMAGEEGHGSDLERHQLGKELSQRMKDYASDSTGHNPWCEVWSWAESNTVWGDRRKDVFSQIINGQAPRKGQRIVYVDGGFDLFSSGHIEFLRLVAEEEGEAARRQGWFDKDVQDQRIRENRVDFGPVYIVAGVHDDEVINSWKGLNYPIMNIYERGLCVLQCRYIRAIIFSAPFTPTHTYLKDFPYGAPTAVYHGPTTYMPLAHDPYLAARQMGVFRQVRSHDFQTVNAGEIVERILRSREMYEERQRLKGIKGIGEEAAQRREAGEQGDLGAMGR